MAVRRAFLLAVVFAAPVAHGQTPQATNGVNASADLAAFDVVSVRPVPPGGRMMLTAMIPTPDGIRWQSVPLSMLVQRAYGGFTKLTTEDCVIGLPDWGKSQYFTVQAKMSEAQAAEFKQLNKDEQEQQRWVMLQALLADRFKLKVHRETKQVPDYELVVAKGGPKFKEGDINPNGPKDKNGQPIPGSFLGMHGIGNAQVQAYSMEQLANFLTQPFVGVGRIVKDKTGLTGRYSFALSFAPSLGSAPGPTTEATAADNSAPAIFTALQDQLGLKLQPGTGTLDVVVIDHVEPLTEN